jgi:hypothetical protein
MASISILPASDLRWTNWQLGQDNQPKLGGAHDKRIMSIFDPVSNAYCVHPTMAGYRGRAIWASAFEALPGSPYLKQ